MADTHLRNLSLKMEQLRLEQSCVDITMECNNGVVFAHKNVLIASCKYFEKMFTIEMAEKQSGRVRFSTISKNVIEIIVKYLYTAQIPDLSEDCVFVRELIQTCHMMELNEFLVSCWEQTTMHHLNLDNFADLWAIGVDFDCCKKGPIELYLKDNLKEIAEKTNLTNLTAIHLIKMIECIDHKAFCKECIQLVLEWKSGSTCSSREGNAAEIFRKIDLSNLDDMSLHALLQQNEIVTKKEDSIENVLTQEAVGRLPKQCNTCKAVKETIILNCGKICSYNIKCRFHGYKCGNCAIKYFDCGKGWENTDMRECNAEGGLNIIKSLLDQLP